MKGRPRIGYCGMTHLGLSSAIASAEKGYETICFDQDVELVSALMSAKLPVTEPDMPELFAKNLDRLVFSSNQETLKQCDVVYVAPDISTDDQGESDLSVLQSLLDLVDDCIRDDAVQVILSQVPPGFTRSRMQQVRPLYYQVETLIFGRAVERALYPERFIIGCVEPEQPLPAVYQEFLESFGCPILQMRFESAELAKISINCCLVSSISVANTLAEICERIGADWNEIVPALKLDKRIGPHSYLSPGLGIAGGNLERDLATVIRYSDQVGSDASIVRAWVGNSRYRKMAAARMLKEHVLDKHPDPLVAIWGLAYKENTHSIKNSPSVATLAEFPDCRFRVHDPVVPADLAGHRKVEGVDNPLSAATGADVLMILTPWQEYKDVDPSAIANAMTGNIIIDPYRVLDEHQAIQAGLSYYTLGKQPMKLDTKL